MFLDESGFMLQPVRQRTWAPRGQTPVQYSWDRHDRLSAVSALTVAPLRRRMGLYFRLHSRNIHAAEVVAFLFWLHRHQPRRLIVILDRWNVHRKAVRVLQEGGADWLQPEWLPPYAPDLNPAEQVWNHAKYADLANFIPDDLADLDHAVRSSMAGQQNHPSLLRSYFHLAGLEL